MTDLTAKEIADRAEQYRHTEPSMGNYKMLMNDAWVMMRELAKRVDELTPANAKAEGSDAGPSG